MNDLKTIAKGAKLSIKDGHIVCPVCRMKTRQIDPAGDRGEKPAGVLRAV